MKICSVGTSEEFGVGRVHAPDRTQVSRPALAQWITPHELEVLRCTLTQGGLPPDFLGKLKKLTGGNLSHHFIEQNCRLFAALLMAAETSSFREGSPAERERLLRVLAYVRKEDDAIPDYLPEGFADDQREIRSAAAELAALIQAFKVWRLRYQVPAIWADQGDSARQSLL